MMSPRITTAVRTLPRHPGTETLSRRASLNALAAVLDYGARLAVGFAINPLLVKGLGDFGFGTWQVLDRLIGYVGPASGRATQALKLRIANQQSSEDETQKRQDVGGALGVWLMFLPLLLLSGGVIAWFSPEWLGAAITQYGTIRLAAGLLVAELVLTSLGELPRSVLEGQNLGYKRMGLSALLVIGGGALIKTGLVGVAAASVVGTAMSGCLYLRVARSNVAWFGFTAPTADSVKRVFLLSWWLLLWNGLMKVMRGSDVVLLGLLASMELVTSYSLTKYVPETIVNLVAMVVFATTPGLGGLIGAGDRDRARHVRGEIMAYTWLVTTAVGATTLVWNRAFLKLWVGGGHYAGPFATLLIILSVIQFVLIRNDSNIIDLTLQLRTKVLVAALSTGLSLVLGGVLVRVFDLGIPGLCVGLMAGRIVLSLAYPWLVGRFLGLSTSRQLQACARPALVTALLFWPATIAGKHASAGSWMALTAWVAATVAPVCLLAFCLGLSSAQRAGLLRRLPLLLPAGGTRGGLRMESPRQ